MVKRTTIELDEELLRRAKRALGGGTTRATVEEALRRAADLAEAEATAMIVNGFIEPITRELPMEYAVELNRLIELQMEGSVG